MFKWPKPKGLTAQILLAMFLGLIVGALLNPFSDVEFIRNYILDGALLVIGKIFIASLKLLVVPLVLVSLVCGTASLDDISKLGRVGGKTLGLYIFTTAVAITVAIAVGILFKPGSGFELQTDAAFIAKEKPPFTKTLIDIFPTNPIKAMADGNMLQIIVFSILLGIALTLTGSSGKKILDIFESANDVIMKMVMMIMALAPFGVFCLLAQVFADKGLGAILPLAKYFFILILVLLFHAFIVYGSLIKFVARLNPVTFFKNFRNVPAFAFSTSSSNATIPVTLEAVEHRMGVSNSIASFTVPLGATINMDGTAIMQGLATIFIAQAYGIDIGIAGYLSVIVTATLSSIGTAGVPGVGLITLAMVLKQVNLPVEGIALIIGVDRILDMTRTVVNVTGDAAVSVIVAKSEGKFDQKIFDRDQG